MADAKRDNNLITTLLAVSNADQITPVVLWADPVTHRLLVALPSSGVTLEVPTGTVDGVNTTFTVGNTPIFVVIDGLVRRSTKGYTYAGGTITVDPLSPPNYDIFSIH